jgi:hypothetical protein
MPFSHADARRASNTHHAVFVNDPKAFDDALEQLLHAAESARRSY